MLVVKLLLIFALLSNVECIICNKHIEYREFGNIIESIPESKVNCSENYCTHVTIDIHDIFTGYEWGCRSDMDIILNNLLIASPGMKKEIDIMKKACNVSFINVLINI